MRSLAWIAVVAVSGTAAAQPASESATASMLEHEVDAQLAARGLVLSRRGLALQLEQLGGPWLVSLVDLTTGRAAASATIDALPAEHGAALAAIARVATDLAHQLGGDAAPVEADRPGAESDAAVRREIDELRYRRRSIRFDKVLDPGGHQRWVFQRGELNQDLDPAAFYRLVDRDDLAQAYTRRHAAMVGGFVLGATTLVLAGVLATSFEENPPCDTAPSVDGSGMCILVRHPSAVPILVMTGLGAAEVAVSTYLLFRPQPIDETEARSLADAYNRRLRRRLGLPDVVDRARVQDLAVVPYVGQRQAGVVLTARF